MLEKTDLKKAKSVAEMLLYTEPQFDRKIDFVVHHPFFNLSVGAVKRNGKLEPVDLRKPEDLQKAREGIAANIQRIENYISYLSLITPPYLPLFFLKTNRYLSIEDFSSFLGAMWVTVEFPNADPNVTTEDYVRFFSMAKSDILMEPEELEIYRSLPDEITVYRGITGKGRVKKLSWTFNKEKAQWFANRWNADGKVYTAKIKKGNVFAYFGGRGEDEVVLNPAGLYSIKKL